MANVSVYFEALTTFNTPATARQVHDKAVEMFGEQVKGDRISARQSLERYVLRGKVDKQDGRYQVSMSYVDPISTLTIENRTLKAEAERLRKELAALKAQQI